MNRQEAMELMKVFMPSWSREFNDRRWLGELGWLYSDGINKLPDTIPIDYLVGRAIIDSRGRQLTVVDENHYAYRDKEVPKGRTVNVDWMQFPGHPHMYAKLKVRGTAWRGDEDGRTFTTNVFDKEIPKEQPELKNVRHNHEIELFRILPQEDIDEAPYDWESYEAGCRTNRFLKFSELYATAIYVALLRVEGPFYLVDGDSVYAYNKKNLIITVSSRGTVRFYNEFAKAFIQK